ncbi:MAG: hypothetical protein Q9208_006707 [Pyrenodesmia sp. 3 TL-2023]
MKMRREAHPTGKLQALNRLERNPHIIPPIRPWNENTCQDPSLAIHLTVAWGQNLPGKYIYQVLQEAKKTFQIIIDSGHIDLLHPKTDVNAAELLFVRDLVITTRPYLKYPWSKVVLTIRQCIEALSLLERCGWRMQNYEEMWAFIYLGKVQVGYIWLRQKVLESDTFGDGNGNRTPPAGSS